MVPTAVVVDDHPAFRRMARRLLIAAGYEVVGEASDIREARQQVVDAQPALVLLDVLLPDGNGIDLADELTDEGRIILLTSSRTAEELGPELGAKTFVTKSELSLQYLAGLRNQ
ncbi:MAG TPA: response regulator [Acidimicrobiales bacterium]|nr:response regulator [Acidimicrobiales bacterium]